MRRTDDCVEGGNIRESRLGGRRCFYRLGVGWWVYKIERVLRSVLRLIASRAERAERGGEARRASGKFGEI